MPISLAFLLLEYAFALIKQRFRDDEIAQLLQLKWWNWDIAKISRNIPLIMSGDIPALCNAA